MHEGELGEQREVEPLSAEEQAEYLLQCAGAIENPILKSFLLGLTREAIDELADSDDKKKLQEIYARELGSLSKDRV